MQHPQHRPAKRREAAALSPCPALRQRFLAPFALLFALLLTVLPGTSHAASLFGLVGLPSVDIEGYDWLGDLYLEHTLKVLSTGDGRPEPTIDSVFVEDALWLLSGQVQQQGYLYPAIRAKVRDEAGAVIYEGTWDNQELLPPPSPGMIGAHVLFTIDAGTRFYFNAISIEGLPADLGQRPESFFYPTDRLLDLDSNRFYTRERGVGGLQAIISRLRAMGYREARIVDQAAHINRKTGAVAFEARIDHGDIYYVNELVIDSASPQIAAETLEGIALQQQFSLPVRLTPEWVQAHVQSIRNRYYAQGYPEVRLTVRLEDPSLPPQHDATGTATAEAQSDSVTATDEGQDNAANAATAKALQRDAIVSAELLQPSATNTATTTKAQQSGNVTATATETTDAPAAAGDDDAFMQAADAAEASVSQPVQEAAVAAVAAGAAAAVLPDAAAMSASQQTDGDIGLSGSVTRRVVIHIESGPKVKIGTIGFSGEYGTRQGVLDEQLTIYSGEELNRNEVEESRSRLSALGIFRSIDIDYKEVDEATWDVTYVTTMKQRTSVSLIAGIGTFDIVRGGFIVEQNNLFGLAHNQRLKAIQSLKATDIDYRYDIPQLFGQDVDFYAKGTYLYREQISFNRQEYGAATGLQRYVSSLRTTFNVQYSLEQLSARNRSFTVPPGPTQATVAALSFKASYSDLDNPIFPTNGWQAQGSTEFAVSALGGDVDYQRVELGVAWHVPLNDSGLIFHTGLRHGVITTSGQAVNEIPVNRRFFMGGENTVRGYRRDQASPRDASGSQIGAVSFLLWQIELEQRLTESISVVTFLDTLGNAADISQYPFNETVASLGIGLSYRTFVGPLRLEYGYNIKKRTGDPDGTIQVSIGFPF